MNEQKLFYLIEQKISLKAQLEKIESDIKKEMESVECSIEEPFQLERGEYKVSKSYTLTKPVRLLKLAQYISVPDPVMDWLQKSSLGKFLQECNIPKKRVEEFIGKEHIHLVVEPTYASEPTVRCIKKKNLLLED